MGPGQRQVRGSEEGEAGEGGDLGDQLGVPVGEDGRPHHPGPLALGGGNGEDGGGVGEAIQGQELPDMDKP